MRSLLLLIALGCVLAGFAAAQQAMSLPDTARARTHFTRGNVFATHSQFDSANASAEQARAIYERAAHSYNDANSWDVYVRCLNLLGNNLRKQGEYEKALRILQQALHLGETKLGAVHAQVGITYGLIGVVYWSKGEYERVEEFYRKALTVKQQAFGENHLEVANGYNNFGIFYWNKGDYDLALSYYLKALAIRRSLYGENHAQVGQSYNNLGIVYWNKGDYERATEYYLKAQSVLLQTLEETDPAISNLYNNLAIIYDERGDYDMALAYYTKSRDLRRQTLGEEHPEVAASYANLGDTYYRKGQYREALDNLQRGLRIYQKSLEENHSNFAQCYLSLGLVHAALGEYDEALAQYELARQVYVKAFGAQHPDLAACYNMSGKVHAQRGEHTAAVRAYEQARALAQHAFGAQHPIVAEAEFNLGEIYFALREHAAALQHYQRALLALVPSFADTTLVSNPTASALPALPLLSDILRAKAEALAQSSAARPPRLEAMHAAFATHVLHADLLDRLRTDYQAEGSKLLLAQKARASYALALQSALQLYEVTRDSIYQHHAFAFAEKSKVAVLAEALQETKARQFAGMPDSVLEQERTLRIDLAYYDTQIQKEQQAGAERDSLRLVEFAQRHFKLKAQYQKFVENLEQHYPKYYALKYHRPVVAVNALQRALAAHEVLVEYFIGDRTIYIFTISPKQFTLTAQAKAADFDQTVTGLLRAVKKVEKAAFVQHSRALFEALLAPIQKTLAGAQRLIIIPDGKLCYVPFEALLTGAAPPAPIDFAKLPYLIRAFEISYHYSANLWHEAATPSVRDTVPAHASFVGFAPVFSDSVIASNTSADPLVASLRAVLVEGKHYGALPYTASEVAKIAALFARKNKTSAGYLHGQATEANFKQALPRYRYVHVATHGLLNEAQPKLSGLLFSPTPEAAQEDDGILYSGETYNLNTHAELVVLSSCESGVGQFVQGEGLMALTRGFMYSGVPNIVVSLWKVYDQHTSDLMLAFYQNLLAGKNYAASLRAAKLRMLTHSATALPVKWSAFVLVGR